MASNFTDSFSSIQINTTKMKTVVYLLRFCNFKKKLLKGTDILKFFYCLKHLKTVSVNTRDHKIHHS